MGVRSNLFIVENSDDERKVVRYIRGRCAISRPVDAAMAYFESVFFLEIDRQWQGADRNRVRMGNEIAVRTSDTSRHADAASTETSLKLETAA